MNSLSDTLTMGIVLALVFGSLIFYIYSRLLQVEKRMALTENILLDLKMATENTLLAMSSHDHDEQAERIETLSGPEPVLSQEVEEIPEEDFYKNILASASASATAPASASSSSAGEASEDAAASVLKEIEFTETTSGQGRPTSTKVEPNYESMSLKELKSLAKNRGLQLSSHAGKKEVIDTLKKGSSVEAGSSSSTAFPIDGAETLE
jgi:hypothetical protein